MDSALCYVPVLNLTISPNLLFKTVLGQIVSLFYPQQEVLQRNATFMTICV